MTRGSCHWRGAIHDRHGAKRSMNTSRLWIFSILFTLSVMASACGPVAIEPTTTLSPTGTAPLFGSSSPTVARTTVAEPTASATVEPTRPVETPSEFTAPLQETQVHMPFAMDWSPSGGPIAITTEQGLLLLNPEDISEAQLSQTENPLQALAIHPEGTRVATAENPTHVFRDSGARVFIWDASSAQLVHALEGFINNEPHALFYDRQGNLIIAVDAGPVDAVEIGSYGEGNSLGFSFIPNATRHDPLALNLTNNQVAVNIFDRIEIWTEPFEPVSKFEAPSAAELEFSPDGGLLAAPHHDCKLRLWDPETGEVAQSFTWCEDPEGTRGTLAFSRDGRLLAVADGQGTILVWEVAKDQTHQEIKLPSGPVLGLAFDPAGGKLASLHEDGLLQIWEIEG